jgi:HNH endonuclease
MSTATKRRKRLALGQRYGWLCWFCDEAIDSTPDSTGADPMRATLHHTAPLSAGGSNALWNLRLMHAHCQAQHHAATHNGAPDSAPQDGGMDR